MRKLLNRLTTKNDARFSLAKEYEEKFYQNDHTVVDKDRRQLLSDLINHAVSSTSYYRGIISEKLLSEMNQGFITPESLITQLPILNKEQLRSSSKSMENVNKVTVSQFYTSSGGSTGEPVRVLQDSVFYEINEAHHLLVFKLRGCDPFDYCIKVWGAERDTFEGKKPFSMKIRDFIRNRIVFNCFRMNRDDMSRILSTIEKNQPQLIVGYVDALYELAKFGSEQQIQMPNQKAIHSGAGVLHPYMRKEIEEYFGTKVFNHYGCREIGAIATECNQFDGLHILEHKVYIEILDDKGSPVPYGEEGNIVITDLTNFSMPLIRYAIGDRGAMQEYCNCNCGSSYRKLQHVSGRTGEQIKTKDGAKVSLSLFAHLFGVVTGESQPTNYLIHQVDLDNVRVYLPKENDFSSITLNELNNKLSKALGDINIDFLFKEPDFFKKTLTGKKIHFMSDLNNE
ncbi:phenylacetate--CoA ligase family protein [Vibrio splendidus]